MFKDMFNKRKINGKCYVLYCFKYDQNTTIHLFNFLLKYFDEQINMTFKYMGFYDKHYINNYGKLEVIRNKIEPSKWNEILNITLDLADMRGSEGEIESKIRVDFGITRPIEIFVVISNEIKFDFSNFTNQINTYFKSIYGFSYDVDINFWPTAYAVTDWDHAKENPSMKWLVKDDLARFSKGCEKLQEGYIRDVYKENVLSPIHLNRMVNGRKLSEIIVTEDIGSLKSINEELILWKLNDEVLNAARKHSSLAELKL